MKTVDFTGSVIEATMRPQDLVPAIMDVLSEYYPEAHEIAVDGIFDAFGLTYTDLCSRPLHMAWQSSEMGYLLHEDLWDSMNKIASAGHYFGARPGDGCDYGFWRVKSREDNTCFCCGSGIKVLVPCPACGEPVCGDCLPPLGAHICEVD